MRKAEGAAPPRRRPDGAAPPRPPRILALLLLLASAAVAQDPFADAVVSFTPGAGSGFGAELLPDVVLGPPRGGGAVQQSLDVVSLGNDGVITVRFDLPVICDGRGADFTVFENAFHVNTPSGPVFEEFGIVAVSQDGVDFVELPYDAISHGGLAGRVPVLSDPDNGIDPLQPAESGGDSFDLATVGLAWVAYVRITDPGAAIPDPGNRIPPGDKGGFDLDAVAALHACDPAGAATPTPTLTPLPTATPLPPRGDLDGDGALTEADRWWLVRELFDGDGDDAMAAAGGALTSPPGVDVDADGRVTASDLAAMAVR